jgi:Family of unknown function (DUF5681)
MKNGSVKSAMKIISNPFKLKDNTVNPNWQKGTSSNPQGRPKGLKNSDLSMLKVSNRLRYKHKVHPVDQLVELALMAKLNKDYELASDIWLKLLQYMEPAKKPIESAPEKPTTPAESVQNAEALLKELEDMANVGQSNTPTVEPPGNRTGLETGSPSVQAEARPEEDLQQRFEQ